MKKVLVAVLIANTFVVAGEQFSMSEADKKMYEELLENNPADMDVEAGMELFEELGDEEALAKFLEVEPKALAEYIAGFPRYVKKMGNVVGIDQVLQALQVVQGEKMSPLNSDEIFTMQAYVKSLANDIKINIDVKENKKMEESYTLGESLYMTARGYRGLSCNSCHALDGAILRTQPLPEMGKANTGGTWPAYRMTLSKLITMQERSRGCMRDAGQEPLPLGSKEMVALEVYITNLAKKHEKVIAIPGLKR
ncbi:MAG TPA: sulfur oxidation c-type cytochrome SoxA [Campylobacterales bacterium]|nr:sulfur oxidation c-type cytochrome SoxA [Campylobacterales bacterium]HHS92739.1 sulfur oxidation c-type cytochrome SoxA [Campylobacterales bacterium]